MTEEQKAKIIENANTVIKEANKYKDTDLDKLNREYRELLGIRTTLNVLGFDFVWDELMEYAIDIYRIA